MAKGVTTMKLSDNPCKRDCPKRSPTCHIACPNYAEYKAKRDKENEALQKKRDAERRLDDAEVARHRKR